MEGFIKTFRKKLECGWFKDPPVAHLYEYLSLSASYSDIAWRDIIVKRGQLISSRKKMAEETGLSEKIVRRCLNALKRAGEINIESNNQYTLVTINNYSEYQGEDQQKASNGPAMGQQRATKKNNKNKKKMMRNISCSGMSLWATLEPDKQDSLDFDEFVAYFNGKVKYTLIPKVIKLNKLRKELLAGRVKEYGKESLATAVEKVVSSTFLTGGTGKFVANFDWIFKPKNFIKILEGNYDNSLTQQNIIYAESSSNRYQSDNKPSAQERINAEIASGIEYFNNIDETGGSEVCGIVPKKVW